MEYEIFGMAGVPEGMEPGSEFNPGERGPPLAVASAHTCWWCGLEECYRALDQRDLNYGLWMARRWAAGKGGQDRGGSGTQRAGTAGAAAGGWSNTAWAVSDWTDGTGSWPVPRSIPAAARHAAAARHVSAPRPGQLSSSSWYLDRVAPRDVHRRTPSIEAAACIGWPTEGRRMDWRTPKLPSVSYDAQRPRLKTPELKMLGIINVK
jgi:hypothetical protein